MRVLLLLPVLLFAVVLGACSDGGQKAEPTVAPKHILLITLDTTRQDRIGAYGHRVAGVSPTPAIDAVAGEGQLYRNAYASTPLTLPSHATMLTGLEPPQHGVRENNDFILVERAKRDFTTLAEELSKAGFATAAFTSSRVIAADFGLAAGFGTYDDVEGAGGGGHSHYEERDALSTTTASLAWLDKLEDNRSFMWVHYFDPHHPYRTHEGRAAAIAQAGDPYDGEIAFMDSQIGRVVQAYKERGLWENTLVMIVGDHGEGLGEHGEESHGFLLHDATMRVPFIVKPADGFKLTPRRTLARTIDIAPTVRAFSGLEIGQDMPGRSLTAQLEDGACAYGESVYPFRQFNWAALYSLRRDNWLLIDGGGRSLLFHHLQDPHELQDLAPSNPAKVRELSDLLLRERRRFASRIKTDSRRDADGTRSSAYIGGPSPEVPEEPGVDENKRLAHPRERMVVLQQLNRLIRLLESLQNGRDESARQEAFVEAQIVVGLLRRNGADSPSVRFWLGRAQWKMGASPLAAALGRDFQLRMLNAGISDFEAYLKQRTQDHRAWNMRLSILHALYRIDEKKERLEAIDKLVREQVGRGLQDGLMFNLQGRALSLRARHKEALDAFKKAVALAPANRSFRRDRDRAEKLVK